MVGAADAALPVTLVAYDAPPLQLVHLMFDPPGNGPCGLWSGGHLFSRDGTRWSPIYRAYNTTVALEGGGSVTFQRRERPKLIFDAAGTPTHLFNAVFEEYRGGYGRIIVQALDFT